MNIGCRIRKAEMMWPISLPCTIYSFITELDISPKTGTGQFLKYINIVKTRHHCIFCFIFKSICICKIIGFWMDINSDYNSIISSTVSYELVPKWGVQTKWIAGSHLTCRLNLTMYVVVSKNKLNIVSLWFFIFELNWFGLWHYYLL